MTMPKRKTVKRKRLQSQQHDTEQRICFDCRMNPNSAVMSDIHSNYCVHFTPEYWMERGFERDWGDASVMNWPYLEILRHQTTEGCKFLVLAPHAQRRPVELYTSDPRAWGAY